MAFRTKRPLFNPRVAGPNLDPRTLGSTFGAALAANTVWLQPLWLPTPGLCAGFSYLEGTAGITVDIGIYTDIDSLGRFRRIVSFGSFLAIGGGLTSFKQLASPALIPAGRLWLACVASAVGGFARGVNAWPGYSQAATAPPLPTVLTPIVDDTSNFPLNCAAIMVTN